MSNKVATKVARSLFSSHATALEPRDPLYETSVDSRTGKPKRNQRPLPPGLTKDERKALKNVRCRAHYLDKGFSICGFRFGWTFLIGFIPVIGDTADALLSYYLVIKPARNCNLPPLLVQRMLLNQILATSVGLIPIIGDLIVAIWKVNSRNAALFEDFLVVRGQRALDDSQLNQVSPSETAALVENSKKTSYIDGMTGDREPTQVQANPVPSSSQTPMPPGGLTSDNNESNKIRKQTKGWFKMKN